MIRDDYLANVSHELRTPLTGVLAMTEALQTQAYGPLNVRQQQLQLYDACTDKCVRFVVWDTGIGIALEDRDKLFRRFSQLDSSLTRRHAGTGLGLALVKRMAELHGGHVGVESSPGQGSRFCISLPWRAAGGVQAGEGE